ncbi:MFS transporter [Atlantibacter hermannii]|uniref:MFS transporter n=1 Tax=Atlantibacter hermannii TaxID=565 RepID=UPI0019324D66|nr:MFS transporter [Atlantibacter hermannii]MBL7637435.1 MFS transporter [Atlantibacter hermannii]MBL7673942.1 MFS transporter [Atlantibacter hermannii]
MNCQADKACALRIDSPSSESSPLSPRIRFLFSLTCGLAVANVYSAQPLLESIAASMNVQPGTIGTVVTATQTGYAMGLLFLVPLGDRCNRKTLVLAQLLLSVLALTTAAFAANFMTLLGAMLLVGLMAVVAQLIVAWAATLAPPEQRGKVVGSVTSGIVLGILSARFVSGSIADLAGWRAVYLTAACLLLLDWLVNGASGYHSLISHMDMRALFSILFQVYPNTLFGYWVWNSLIKRYPVSTVAPLSLLVPVFGILGSVMIFCEHVPAMKIVALALIITGLAIGLYGQRLQRYFMK